MEMVMAYNLANQFPRAEKFGSRGQITRCTVSIPSNFAEGSVNKRDKDYKNNLQISPASTSELETKTLIVEMPKLDESDLMKCLLKGVDEEEKVLQSFMKAIERS